MFKHLTELVQVQQGRMLKIAGADCVLHDPSTHNIPHNTLSIQMHDHGGCNVIAAAEHKILKHLDRARRGLAAHSYSPHAPDDHVH